MRDVSTARHVQSFDRIAIVKLGAIRKLLAISAICNLEFHQIDIGSAFLVVELEEALCMENPEGFEIGEKPGSVEWGGVGLMTFPFVWRFAIQRGPLLLVLNSL